MKPIPHFLLSVLLGSSLSILFSSLVVDHYTPIYLRLIGGLLCGIMAILVITQLFGRPLENDHE
jgi:hypothetical protein